MCANKLVCTHSQEGSQRIGMAVTYAILLFGVIVLAFTSSRIDPVDKTIHEQLQQTPREVCMYVLCACTHVYVCVSIIWTRNIHQQLCQIA
jgi:hypothetical protein